MMDAIERKFLNVALVHRKIHLYDAQTAIKVIEECRSRGKNILGIDAFIISGDFIKPFLEYSSDYSRLLDKINTWDTAKEHILQYFDHGLLFEVVYE